MDPSPSQIAVLAQRPPTTTNHALKHRSPDNDTPDAAAPRPPVKRVRKAVNCEPCRASKLKCDKAHPCSSCVLRGTASQCFMDRKDDRDHRHGGLDPHGEIARMRQSLATLESFIIRGPNATTRGATSSRNDARKSVDRKDEPPSESLADNAVPGMLGEGKRGGFYAGPTSTATLLYSLRAANDQRDGSANGDDVVKSDGSVGGGGGSGGGGPSSLLDDTGNGNGASTSVPTDIARGYDDDLLALLPAIHIIDGLVDFYFEYCNWMFRHVNESAFLAAWRRFRVSASADRLVLATLAVVMAVAARYLPEKHALLAGLDSASPGPGHGHDHAGSGQGQTREALGERWYAVAKEAYKRYRAECRVLSLELVELLLIRTHYLTISKTESEEIWAIRGEVVSIGTAMGLHRDPDKWHMPRDVAERRRWAWWHIILLERWQCFLFGRPLSVASHHFDTRLPSYCDPAIDKTQRLYMPNIHLFKLAHILADIVDDAVSIRPVPYARVQEQDAKLERWLEELPKELDLDEYRLARALASPLPSDVRHGVLSVLIRASYYHIRFTLHRPYAAAAHDHASTLDGSGTSTPTGGGTKGLGGRPDPTSQLNMHEYMATSLDTAASGAAKLIQLASQTRPDVIGTTQPAVPVHVHWGPFHCFSAAMFFSFQLIANPEQPGANLFRANIARVLDILSLSKGVPVADRAMDILTALAPLYDVSYGSKGALEREKTKHQVLSLVKTLAFPYQDSLESSRAQGNPSAMDQRHAHPGLGPLPPYVDPPLPHAHQSAALDHPGMHNPHSHAAMSNGSSLSHGHASHYDMHQSHSQPPPPTYHQHVMPDAMHPDDSAMWGASVGFQQGEWTRFVDVMQRPDTGAPHAR